MRLARDVLCWTWFTGLLAVSLCVAVPLALLDLVLEGRAKE